MPPQQKKSLQGTAATKTAVATKTQIKTSTLVAMAWAVAFAAMGLALTPPKAPQIYKFYESKKSTYSSFFGHGHTASIAVKEINAEDALNFTTAVQRPTSRLRYSHTFLSYSNDEAGVNNADQTVPPSEADVLSVASDSTWSTTNTRFNVIAGALPGVTDYYADAYSFIGVASADGTTVNMLDYAIIRYHVSPGAITARPVVLRKDTSFANRTGSLPTGVLGATNVKIAAFTVSAPTTEAVDVSSITLKDPTGAVRLGHLFQNLKVLNNNAPVGSVIGTLNESSTLTSYVFTLDRPIRMAAGDTQTFEVFADIKNGPIAYVDTLINPVVVVSKVMAIGVVSSGDASSRLAASLQSAFVTNAGSLTVSLDTGMPVASVLVMGQRGIEVGRFKLTAGSSEDVTVNQLVVSDLVSSVEAAGTLKNIRLFVSSTPVGGVVPAFDRTGSFVVSPYGSAISATFPNLNLRVPVNSSVVLKVVADNESWDNGAMSSSTHRIALLPDVNGPAGGIVESITAVGANSGQPITGNRLNYTITPDAPVVGNQLIAFRTRLAIGYASNTPSGTSMASSEQTIARLRLVNSENVGAYDATMQKLNFNFYQVGIANTAPRNLRGYLDQIDATPDFEYTFNGNFAATTMSETDFVDIVVPAGATRDLYITLDTSDAGATDTLSFSVAYGFLEWSDGITQRIQTSSELPLAYKTFRY